jgi:hypothetical protein
MSVGEDDDMSTILHGKINGRTIELDGALGKFVAQYQHGARCRRRCATPAALPNGCRESLAMQCR